MIFVKRSNQITPLPSTSLTSPTDLLLLPRSSCSYPGMFPTEFILQRKVQTPTLPYKKHIILCSCPQVFPPLPSSHLLTQPPVLFCLFCFALFFFFFFKTRFLYVAPAVLKLAVQTRIASNSEKSACFCLPSVGIKCVLPLPGYRYPLDDSEAHLWQRPPPWIKFC